MSEKFGKKLVIISAVTLLLAACSKKEEPEVETPTNTGPAVVEEPAQPVERAPTPAELEAERLRDLHGTRATVDTLTSSAGNDRIFFEYDSSELTADARATLQKQAAWLLYHTRTRVTIEGHCDERGTREYNLALGERRATAVKNYLVALNVPASRIQTISYGKERPASVGNYAQNRRGVMVVNN